MESIKVFFETIYYVLAIIGVPVAIYQYFSVKKKESLDREYGTYDALDEKYLEYQDLCLKYTYLDIFDIPDARPGILNEIQKKEELIAFTMLISILERAYLMCHKQPGVKIKQWSGWKEYIIAFCGRANFRIAWKVAGTQFDSDFKKFVDSEINKISQSNLT